MEQKQHPLIIVFYLDKEMMKQQQIISPFVETVNQMLEAKESNVLAFFIPTEGEERVECINPVLLGETDINKINVMIEDIKKNFSIGGNVDPSQNVETPINAKEYTCDGGESNCNCGNKENN